MVSELFDVERVEGVTVVRLAGTQFDSEGTVERLRDELESLIDKQHPRKLLVSFCRVPHVTSRAFVALLSVREKVHEAGGTMKLCAMHPAIRDAFTVLDLDAKLVPIHHEETEALNAFQTHSLETNP